MATPRLYYSTQAELSLVKARAFQLLMSDEISSIEGPFASALFDLVGAMSEQEADDDIRSAEAEHS